MTNLKKPLYVCPQCGGDTKAVRHANGMMCDHGNHFVECETYCAHGNLYEDYCEECLKEGVVNEDYSEL